MSAGTVFIPPSDSIYRLVSIWDIAWCGACVSRKTKHPSAFSPAHPSLSTFLHAQIHCFEQWNPFPSASLRKIARQPNESDGENAAIGVLPPRKQWSAPSTYATAASLSLSLERVRWTRSKWCRRLTDYMLRWWLPWRIISAARWLLTLCEKPYKW
jgi:hypothetical protein